MNRRPNDRSALPCAAAILGLLAFAAGLAGPAPAWAQWGDTYDAPPQDPYYAPRRPRGGYRDDGYARPQPRRYVPPPQQESRSFYWPWEDQPRSQPVPQPPPQSAPGGASPQPGYARPSRPRPPAAASRPDEERAARIRRRPSPPPAVAQSPKPAVPKAAATTQVAVFGDSLASYLGKGVDEAFSDSADVAVIDRSKGDSGLVRKDVVDWAKSAEDFLKANPKLSYALMMIGVNDRQAIRDGDQSVEALSDRWRELYAARVDAVIKPFTDAKVPLIWVGLPPVRSDSLTRDYGSINDLVRERVQKAGQTFVDIWQGFVDDRNRFTANGPDVEGQEARLRTADGIHFTSAGARKVAHFADVELKRLMGARGGLPTEQPTAPVATTNPSEGAPAPGPPSDDTAAIDRKITAMLPSLPEPPGIPTLPVKPAAGPVVPLGRAEIAPGGTLMTGRPSEGDATGTRERSLQRGAAPLPQPGRADDFRWPPG